MLISDFNPIELCFLEFFIGFTSPIVFIAVLVLLISRMGWPGVIPFAVFGIFLVACLLLSKLSAKLILKLSYFRDSRTSRIL